MLMYRFEEEKRREKKTGNSHLYFITCPLCEYHCCVQYASSSYWSASKLQYEDIQPKEREKMSCNKLKFAIQTMMFAWLFVCSAIFFIGFDWMRNEERKRGGGGGGEEGKNETE